LDSPEGRLGVGWLVVEDIMMVFALVLLPAMAPLLGGTATPETGAHSLPVAIAIAMGQVVAFAALMFFVGRRLVPWLLQQVARTGSRELFTLAVLTTALGVGTVAAEVFGVSFALGAFFAGAVMSESDLSARAATEALPMQDAFAVLFFVSVGMLFDPATVVARWPQILALIGVIVIWKGMLSYVLLRLLGQQRRSALLIGSALGQIGEFSFIVASLAVSLGLAPPDLQAVIVVAAIAAITINAPVISWIARVTQQLADRDATHHAGSVSSPGGADVNALFDFSNMQGHVVLVGHGRVGSTVADALVRSGAGHVVVEEQERVVAGLRRRGESTIQGDATRSDVLERAGIRGARLVVITAPEPFRARRIVEVARAANPHIAVAVRTHSAAEQAFFEELLSEPGAIGRAVYAEREAALSLAHFALVAIGRPDDEADNVIEVLRGHATAPTETFKSLATREYKALVNTRPSD
jgi:CPA2 family monovalent cation:H+ antiporter-2